MSASTTFNPPYSGQSHNVEGPGNNPDFGGEQVVLILVGLVGSGKSTFAEALVGSHPQFTRCNQDDLGNRARVEELARQTLRQGRSACIDRTNFNASQRAYWIDIAREAGVPVWVIVFDTPYEVCAARLQHRRMHPTIKSPEEGLSVLNRFASEFQKPSKNEGYNRLIHLKLREQSLLYGRGEISSILQRLRDAPAPSINQSFPGFSRRGSQHARGNRSPGDIRSSYTNLPRGRGRGSSRLVSNSRGSGWRLAVRQVPSGTMGNSRSHDAGDNCPTASDTPASQTQLSDSETGGLHGNSHLRGSGSAHDPFTIT